MLHFTNIKYEKLQNEKNVFSSNGEILNISAN